MGIVEDFIPSTVVGMVVLYCVHCASALVHVAPRSSVYGLPVPLLCPAVLADDMHCNGTMAELAEIVSELAYQRMLGSIIAAIVDHRPSEEE